MLQIKMNPHVTHETVETIFPVLGGWWMKDNVKQKEVASETHYHNNKVWFV